MLKITDAKKVDVLLQLEKIASEQLSQIKKDEMSWLKLFLAFYSAGIAWGIQKLFSGTTGNISPSPILTVLALISFIALIPFSYFFLWIRHSYYGVAARLSRLHEALRIHDDSFWGIERPLLDEAHIFVQIDNLCTWYTKTKPFSSFLLRIIMLLGASFCLSLIAWYSNVWTSHTECKWITLLTIVLPYFVLAFLIFVCDFMWFFFFTCKKP
jgi:hypothetical protein